MKNDRVCSAATQGNSLNLYQGEECGCDKTDLLRIHDVILLSQLDGH